MEEQRQRELRGLFHMLEHTAKLVESVVLTGTFKHGENRCIAQFNEALTRLNDLDAIPKALFEPLEADASFGEISLAYQQLTAYLSEALATEHDSKNWMSGFLRRRFLENLEGLNEGKIGELIRKSVPDFLTESTLADIEEDFHVAPGGCLTVDADLGDIDIHPADSNKVEVRVRRSAQLKADRRAGDILKNFDVKIEHDTPDVKIEATFKGTQWKRVIGRLDVQFEITVPRRYDLNLKTACGSLSVASIQGTVNTRTSAGGLWFENVDGVLTARAAAGDIHINSYNGKVDVQTSGGNVQVKAGTGDVNAKTAAGNLRFVEIDGAISGRTSGGNIILNACKAAVDVKTYGGNVEIENEGEVTATVAAGSIRAQMLKQPQIMQQGTPYWTLETTSGSIDVSLMSHIGVTVDAKGLGTRMTTQFDVAGEEPVKAGQLQGTINGGGPLLKLRCMGGAISLKQAEEQSSADAET